MKTKTRTQESNDATLKVVFGAVVAALAIFAYYVIVVWSGNVG